MEEEENDHHQTKDDTGDIVGRTKYDLFFAGGKGLDCF